MKKFLTWVSLGVLLFSGVFAAVTMGKMEPTYNGKPAVSEFAVLERRGGCAKLRLHPVTGRTHQLHSVNDVTSIVFDFRGYDTMGEAFILITAVAGSAVILFSKKSEKEAEKNE